MCDALWNRVLLSPDTVIWSVLTFSCHYNSTHFCSCLFSLHLVFCILAKTKNDMGLIIWSVCCWVFELKLNKSPTASLFYTSVFFSSYFFFSPFCCSSYDSHFCAADSCPPGAGFSPPVYFHLPSCHDFLTWVSWVLFISLTWTQLFFFFFSLYRSLISCWQRQGGETTNPSIVKWSLTFHSLKSVIPRESGLGPKSWKKLKLFQFYCEATEITFLAL